MPSSSRIGYQSEPNAEQLHTAPSGKSILAALVDLLADQEGVSITYE